VHEESELAMLEATFGAQSADRERQAVERAVTGVAVMAALPGAAQPLPPALFQRIEQTAFAVMQSSAVISRRPSAVKIPEVQKRSPAHAWIVAAPWFAAAACLVVAIGMWFL